MSASTTAALRSKSRTAQVNELLMKFLRHNLCVLNHEINELGIAPVFWPNESVSDDSPAIIRFPGA